MFHYSIENPQEIQGDASRYKCQCFVFSAVIGPSFVEDKEGQIELRMNQERYRVMMTNFCMPIILKQRMGFYDERDDAPPHTGRTTIDFF